jgi:hypothetical protein
LQWPSGQCETAAFVIDEEKLIILVQGHECLCNLQHKDYDNNLPHPVPGSLLSEAYQSQTVVAGVNGTVVAGRWQGNGMGRHGMCESVFKTAGERHGMCESVFKTAGEQQGNGMGTAWYV